MGCLHTRLAACQMTFPAAAALSGRSPALPLGQSARLGSRRHTSQCSSSLHLPKRCRSLLHRERSGGAALLADACSLLLNKCTRFQCMCQAVLCLQCLILLSLALRIPEADVHCRDLGGYISHVPPPVSLLSLKQAIADFWTTATPGQPRGIFMCLAAVCGFSVPNGHLLLIQDLDLAMRTAMESPSTVHAELLPQQRPR